MRRVIVGTAGHIDHGKTRLVEALTGVDCDRWAEEKRRGITIDIGFAHIVVDGDLQIGFIDVPGHEKFLHNALAGLGGIRIALLVVAADEGVMPQTREHLAVCDLLAIPAAIVALTKADLVSSDRLAEARLEVEELLAPTRFAGAATVAVSSVTGEGVETLRQEIAGLCAKHARPPDGHRPARLPVDRAFLVKGRGLVVTGTLAAGKLEVTQELVVSPSGERARVRGIQVHGADRDRAEAGERVALQLAGVDIAAVPRGAQLVPAGSVVASQRWAARLHLLSDAPRAIRASVPVRLHLYSAEVMGNLRPLAELIEPASSGMVEIRLARPLAAVRGDRFIVRRPSPAMTIGGGIVLDPHWRRHRGRDVAATLAALEGDAEDALRLWIEEAGEGGATVVELAARLGWTVEACASALAELAALQRAVRVPAGQGHSERWLAARAFRRVEKRAKRVLEEYFATHRLKETMPRAEAMAAILPGRAAQIAPAHLRWLEQRKVLEIHGDKIGLPGRAADLTGGESKLATSILAAYEAAGLTPPAPAEVRDALGAKTQILDGVVKYLLEHKKLERLPGGLLIAASAIAKLRRELQASDEERFSVGDFKQRYGLTRKWAIPLLEHLDSIGVTRRVGNERQIVKR
ncbi:MAG: selenocysteine-specific translation elongation factor [Acidobacteria bacterium]|nr:selenocysteine-specific translation elongation factor [Acidobacteriota bacterium]